MFSLLVRITRNLRRSVILMSEDFLLDMMKGTQAWTFGTKSKRGPYIITPGLTWLDQ